MALDVQEVRMGSERKIERVTAGVEKEVHKVTAGLDGGFKLP